MTDMQAMPIDSILYTLKRMDLIRFKPDSGEQKYFASSHILIAVLNGSGVGLLDGKHYRLGKGGCFLALRSAMIEIRPDAAEGLDVYWIEMETKETGGGGTSNSAVPAPFPFHGRLNVQPLSRWTGLLKAMNEASGADHRLQAFEAHIALQRLLYYLCERNWSCADTPHAAVGRVLDMLHADPTREYSIKELAPTANIGARQFTQLFKDITGLTLPNYVAELRIRLAKRQLLASSDSLSRIARSVGYQDVYYFSRRFKQLEGISPSQYANRKRSGLRIVALYYSGTLLSMGVTPVGANLTWWGGSAYLKDRETHTVNLGITPSMEQIARLEPDLILLNDHNRDHYEQLQKIAPAVFIPYDGHRPVYEEARMLGRLVGNPLEAELFINRYERKASTMRRQLAEAGIPSTQLTAIIVRIEENGTAFSVFGDNYGRGGWSVYRGLRFQPPRMVRKMIDSGVQIRQRLPIETLPDYAGEADYLLVVNEGEGIRHVSGKEVWKKLSAVVHNRVIELSREQISYFDPVSIEAQLELLGTMLQEPVDR